MPAECPKCGWEYPVILPPKRFANGATFDCPSCGSNLTIVANKKNQIILSLSTTALLPSISFLHFSEGKMAPELRFGIIAGLVVFFLALAIPFYGGINLELTIPKEKDQ